MSPLRMHQIRRIIELYLQGRGIRESQRLTGLSRNTIREYLRRIQESGISPQELLALDEASLAPFVYLDAIEKGSAGRTRDTRYDSFENHLEYYCSELQKRGVTRQLLWEEYRQDHPEGYGYSQFCEYLLRHRRRDQAVMHFTHRPGEQLQVDFAGGKLSYVDRSTGEVISCEVLVCAMPYSHYMYAEALPSQQQEYFINGLRHGLEYIGGVPPSIKCDNMKTAVVRANRYEPKFTQAMEYMAEHYGTTILAARVRKPRDKGSVEKAVNIAYQRIYAPLRNQVFYSLEDLNAGIRKQLELSNQRPMKGKAGTRRDLFEADEKPLLKTLPATGYEIKHVTESKVQRNYHVILGEDHHQYSVPHTLIGKRLKIIYTIETVEIYDGLKRVVIHKRNYKKMDYTTLPEHMPAHHQHVYQQRGWDSNYFKEQALRVGPAALKVIDRILTSRSFHEQTYTSCLGVLRLGKKYGNDRLEAACLRSASSPLINYTIIANILRNNLDKVPQTGDQLPLVHHDQIRGPHTYQ
jgi:transposase